MRTNHEEDNWFLQIETFDPHEPFFTQQKYKELYPNVDLVTMDITMPKMDGVTALEQIIDRLEAGLTPLTSFILPGGTASAAAFWARSRSEPGST